MEKLTRKDLELLIELLEQEKKAIHKEAITDAELRAKEIDLDLIKIKLNTQKKEKEREFEG